MYEESHEKTETEKSLSQIDYLESDHVETAKSPPAEPVPSPPQPENNNLVRLTNLEKQFKNMQTLFEVKRQSKNTISIVDPDYKPLTVKSPTTLITIPEV